MNSPQDVWIVDDDRSIRWVLERALSKEQVTTRSFETADDALKILDVEKPSVVITDVRMPGESGLSLLASLRENFPKVPVIVMTAYGDLDHAVAAFQGGAFEYMPKPFDVDDVISIVRRAIRKAREDSVSQTLNNADSKVSGIIGSSPEIQEVFRTIGRLSNSHMTVMITGESGTGKELVAGALHKHSPRADQAFIALNTAAIPSELLESELFGHEKGSFTGATSRRIGRFEQADKGTLFLDEIGDMPADLQTRLLRVLSDGQFYRVGGHQPIKVDVRVIAATHQELEVLVAEGRFREDLFHRLNVISLELPALRERVDDIGELSNYFFQLIAKELNQEAKVFTEESLCLLRAYNWPGNVRQLENVCRRVMVMGSTREVESDELPKEIKLVEQKESESVHQQWESKLRSWVETELDIEDAGPIISIAESKFETVLITAALAHTKGRRQAAAKLLGWGRNTLTRKIKQHQIVDSNPQDS
ncbi:MAG: nitrogen regulation protein NR(I) [Gammaproteobacteria bacterium]